MRAKYLIRTFRLAAASRARFRSAEAIAASCALLFLPSPDCYGSLCRKQHAAPFRSRARAQIKDFRWLQGENLVKYYETSGGYQRGFCRECGSPILNRTAPNSKRAAQSPQSLSQYGIPLAILDDSPVRPECHVFVGSKAPWFEITDKLPQHTEYAPD